MPASKFIDSKNMGTHTISKTFTLRIPYANSSNFLNHETFPLHIDALTEVRKGNAINSLIPRKTHNARNL